MRILVTGGTGHLGGAIVSRLLRDGHRVRILARQPRIDPSVDWINGDLATGEGIRDAVEGVEMILHAATNSAAAQRGRFKLRDFRRSPADVDVEGPAPCSPPLSRPGSSGSRISPSSGSNTCGACLTRAASSRPSASSATLRCRGRSSGRPGSTGCSSGCSTTWPNSRSSRCPHTPAWRRIDSDSSPSTSSSASPMAGAASTETSSGRKRSP